MAQMSQMAQMAQMAQMPQDLCRTGSFEPGARAIFWMRRKETEIWLSTLGQAPDTIPTP